MKVREVLSVNTVVVGSGAAGYNAADRLWQYGQHDILLISEDLKAGTSRNTGSDKQTYYKLTLSSDTPDSIYEMANTLFDGKCVDGDIALCEAALSVQKSAEAIVAERRRAESVGVLNTTEKGGMRTWMQKTSAKMAARREIVRNTKGM